jgi:hypothetical protein
MFFVFLSPVLSNVLFVLQHINVGLIFQDDPSTLSSRHFYISQWNRDSNAEIKRQKGLDKPRKKEKQ